MAGPDSRFNQFDQFKLNTEFGEGYCKHAIVCKSGIRTEEWTKGKLLGRGAFGTVWLEEERRGNLRAVKQIPKTNFLMNFRELLALTKLKGYHQRFVQFFGWFDNDENVYLTMEYVRYGDLASLISKETMDEGKAKAVTKQLLEGLKIMHANQFCHRDLKPQNILVASLSPIMVKISDFGVSKRAGDGTVFQTQVGTANYIAPEVWGLFDSDTSIYTINADLWSLGCLIHTMMTGEVPFPEMKPFIDYVQGRISFPEKKLIEKEISLTAINFITNLVMPLPADRLTAEEALKNPWFNIEEEEGWEDRRNSPSTSHYSYNDAVSREDIGYNPYDPLLRSQPVIEEDWKHHPVVFPDVDCRSSSNSGGTVIEFRKWENEQKWERLNIDDGNSNIPHRSNRFHREDPELLGVGSRNESIYQECTRPKSQPVHPTQPQVPISQFEEPSFWGSQTMFKSEPPTQPKNIDTNARGAGLGSLDDLKYNLPSPSREPCAPEPDLNRSVPHPQQEQQYQPGVPKRPQESRWDGLAPKAYEPPRFFGVNLAVLDPESILPYEPPPSSHYCTTLLCAINHRNLDALEILFQKSTIVLQTTTHSKEEDEMISDLDNDPMNFSYGRVHAKVEGGFEGISSLTLEGGGCILGTYEDAYQALQIPILRGQEEIVSFLLQNWVGVMATRYDGYTALHKAASRDHLITAKALLRYGWKITDMDDLGSTALHEAVKAGHQDMVRLLLSEGANIKTENRYGFAPLHEAVCIGKEWMVALLLHLGADIDAETLTGETALNLAMMNEDKEMVGVLLEDGADIMRRYSDGSTELHRAVLAGQEWAVSLLLDFGADIDAETLTGVTPLSYAIRTENMVIARLLLEWGADPMKKGPDGSTPLHEAVSGGVDPGVRLLLDYGADLSAEMVNGDTALHLAAREGWGDLVNSLLVYGDDIRKKSRNGATALHLAAFRGNLYMAHLLLEKGADPTAKDYNGWTPLTLACQGGHEEVIGLLSLAEGLKIPRDWH